MDRSEFEYELPESAIAQEPVWPRDASRLLDTRAMTDHVFSDLPALLEPGDLLVMNTTRVRRARLQGTRVETGGAVEFLVLDRLGDGIWSALASPARRMRPGVLVDFGDSSIEVLSDPVDGVIQVRIEDESVIERAGEVPLPPYIHRRLEDPDRYQTVYADRLGSAAAPTAGLHFTPQLLEAVRARGVDTAAVELHVGIGTFRPITSHRVDEHRMHAEWCHVPEATASAIAATRRRGGRVVAVGTTTVRTLETFGSPDGTVEPGERTTDLFLRPGSEFAVVDALVTNFHVPGSSLVVMVAAFMGDEWLEAYDTALERGYRFLSFGDAMFCERR